METNFETLAEALGMDTGKESIKLTKNSRGYGWELRLFPPPSGIDEEWLNRIERINAELSKRFSKSNPYAKESIEDD